MFYFDIFQPIFLRDIITSYIPEYMANHFTVLNLFRLLPYTSLYSSSYIQLLFHWWVCFDLAHSNKLICFTADLPRFSLCYKIVPLIILVRCIKFTLFISLEQLSWNKHPYLRYYLLFCFYSTLWDLSNSDIEDRIHYQCAIQCPYFSLFVFFIRDCIKY